MRSIGRRVLALSATALLASSTGSAQTVAYGGVKFTATLTGAPYYDRLGDPDGRGTITVWANTTQNRVCYEIVVRNIQLPGYIMLVGPRVMMRLGHLSQTTSSGCAVSDEYTRGQIWALTSGRYTAPYRVYVANSAYPGGAIWGYLKRV